MMEDKITTIDIQEMTLSEMMDTEAGGERKDEKSGNFWEAMLLLISF
ncbi:MULTISPECIES: hypothetical protein [Sphingobacterium]|nr:MULTISPECIES: hypothetical protein [Sphingobacterium]MCS4228326.1 hypothetical protein [Sphingobacterium sp. BIGb0165]